MTTANVQQLLADLSLDSVPVISTERGLPRKELAKLTRQLFRSMGLRGISVTTPNYSMAQGIEIVLPGRSDYVRDASGAIVDWLTDPAAVANRQAEQRLHSVMAKAFPNHGNRSDSMTDYYDYKYSIDTRA